MVGSVKNLIGFMVIAMDVEYMSKNEQVCVRKCWIHASVDSFSFRWSTPNCKTKRPQLFHAMQLWDTRKEFTKMQDTYRRDSPSTVPPDEVLVSFVDYTSASMDKQVWTLSETKKRIWTLKQIDVLAEELRSLPTENKAEVGPLVVAKIPHCHDAICLPLLLRNPRVKE